MQVKSLKVFCDVVGRRSFSRAATENGMSQSGASQMVHHLEEHLGVRLIDRSKRPFVLTPEGQVFYDGCRQLVEKYFALEDNVRAMHQDVEGLVRVASIYSVGLSHIDRFRRTFLQRFPHAKVQIDLSTHRVQVEPAEADAEELANAIKEAGYTPLQVQAGSAPSAKAAGNCCGGCH